MRRSINEALEELLINVANVQATMEDLRKDAERYRWLRDVGDATWTPLAKQPGVNFTHEIDQAIDAAITKGVKNDNP